jgi:hypothetical protein
MRWLVLPSGEQQAIRYHGVPGDPIEFLGGHDNVWIFPKGFGFKVWIIYW